MAATNLEQTAPATDTTVLGRYYMLAPIEEIRKAQSALQFEIDQHEKRQAISQQAADLAATRLAEVRAEIDAIDAVFDVETTGL